MHLRYAFQRIAFSPSCCDQLSASPHERGEWEDTQHVLDLVLALLCDGSVVPWASKLRSQ